MINGMNSEAFMNNARFVRLMQEEGIESIPSHQTGREWAYDTLLEYMLQDPQGKIAKERQEKRSKGMLKFVCHECALGHHEVCVDRNAKKNVSRHQRTDCDCAHKKVVKK